MNPLGSIDSQVNRAVMANMGNPQGLQKKANATKDLIDLLALQQIKKQQEMRAQQMQAQIQPSPGTVAEQTASQVMQTQREQLANELGGISMLLNKQVQAPHMPAVPKTRARGIPTAAPTARPFRAGGIVAFEEGGMPELDRTAYAALKEQEAMEAAIAAAPAGTRFVGFDPETGQPRYAPEAAVRRPRAGYPELTYQREPKYRDATPQEPAEKRRQRLDWGMGFDVRDLLKESPIQQPNAQVPTPANTRRVAQGDNPLLAAAEAVVRPEQPGPNPYPSVSAGVDELISQTVPTSGPQRGGYTPTTSPTVSYTEPASKLEAAAAKLLGQNTADTAAQRDKMLEMLDAIDQDEAAYAEKNRGYLDSRKRNFDELIARMLAFGGARTFAEGATRSGIAGAQFNREQDILERQIEKDILDMKRQSRTKRMEILNTYYGNSKSDRAKALEVANLIDQGRQKSAELAIKAEEVTATLAQQAARTNMQGYSNQVSADIQAEGNRIRERIGSAQLGNAQARVALGVYDSIANLIQQELESAQVSQQAGPDVMRRMAGLLQGWQAISSFIDGDTTEEELKRTEARLVRAVSTILQSSGTPTPQSGQ